MRKLSKWKWYLLAGCGIFIIFLFTRLYGLGDFPIFTDEAIYVRWTQIGRNDASWRFISLTDGKQPSFIWAGMALLPFFNSPLVALRMVSVISGLFSLVGLFFLSRELFKNTKIGIIAAFIYAVYPMAVVYDRMALYDSMVGTFMIWTFYLTVLLARTLRLDSALILGFLIGGAVLTKTSGFFSIYLLPFATLLVDLRKKDIVKHLIRWALLAGLASLIGYGIYNILKLSPFFYIIAEKNTLFVYPLSEWIKHPFDAFQGNLTGMFDWLTGYLTFPIFFAALLAPIVSRSFIREKLVLLIYCFAPFFGLAIFGNALYPRYVLFMSLYLLPLIAYTIFWIATVIKNKLLCVGILTALFVFPLYAIYGILFDFGNAAIPLSDRGQFYKDWPSGVGVNESLTFFEEEAKKGPIFVATQGTFGLMPYAYEIFLQNNPNVTIKGYYPVDHSLPDELKQQSTKTPTYIVFYQPCLGCPAKGIASPELPLEEVLQVRKEASDAYLTVYKVITDQ